MPNDDARRKPGRPPLDPHQPSVRVGFRVAPQEYDALYQRAVRDRTNISTVIRRSLQRADDDTSD